MEVVYSHLQEICPDIQISNNLPYTKNRSYVERRVKDIKGLLNQLNVYTKAKISLSPQEWQNLLLMLESTLNNTPYCTRSLISPEALVNPRTIVKYLVIPQKLELYDTKIGKISRVLHDIRSAQL